jgi:glycosyltransferase involved in cell wall biosynthesis
MSTRIRVAVCTNRGAVEVAECVAALGAQLGGAPLTIVTSGLPEAVAERHRASFDGEVLVEPRPGLSRARNRALAWTPDGEVLAFVDDDAVVAEGWWGALSRRWDEAPPEVACIGGPIRPRFAAAPPPWFSDAIAPALTVLDRGHEVRELDPSVEAVYGANISFRADPLRQVGGFDPAFGHAGSNAYFGEENEAQLALARLGRWIRYVPDASVWHVIPPARMRRGSFLRRRFAFGASLGARGGRSRAVAAHQALSSAAGCVAAAAQGDERLLMERAVRAAESAGVVGGRLVARAR